MLSLEVWMIARFVLNNSDDLVIIWCKHTACADGVSQWLLQKLQFWHLFWQVSALLRSPALVVLPHVPNLCPVTSSLLGNRLLCLASNMAEMWLPGIRINFCSLHILYLSIYLSVVLSADHSVSQSICCSIALSCHSVLLSISHSIYLSFCHCLSDVLSIILSICNAVYLLFYLQLCCYFICIHLLSIVLSVGYSISCSVVLPVCLYVHLSNFPSICLYVFIPEKQQ